MTTLSHSLQEKINHAIEKYPPNQKKAAVKAALTYAQEENGGWLTTEIMDAIADYLEIPNIAVYEVATFYTLYDLKPVGKYKIQLCTNVSCMLRNCDLIKEYLEKKLGISFGETTADRKFTLKEVECIAACAGAPALQINSNYYENLTVEQIDIILNSLE